MRNLNYVPAEKLDFVPVEEEEELPVGDTVDGKALLERKMSKFQYCLTCGFLLMPGETECFRCKKDQ
ncbi:MAG: hypothetical protein MJ166_04170 [Clostridia bacterium]|nr:hypothetical protein [Clostridia bacterium]